MDRPTMHRRPFILSISFPAERRPAKRRVSDRLGFTLIELLIVVSIISILASIAVPNFLEAQTRAKVSRVKADFYAIAAALESYRVDNNRYLETDIRDRWRRFNQLTTPSQ